MLLLLEIRAGEGGADARLLVRDQARLYTKWAVKHACGVTWCDEGAS